MGNSTSNRRKDEIRYAVELSVSVATLVSAAYFFYTINESISGYTSQESNTEKERRELARKLNRPELESLEFSKHELSVAMDVICPDDLKTSFSDVGGMEKEIDVIVDNVILPFKFWKEEHIRQQQQQEQEQLLMNEGGSTGSQMGVQQHQAEIECHVPGGMLMYGRPGTGKSMLAKAIAKEAGASFIGLKSGTILDKYVGESDKLVTAIFSLAQKIAPTVIFIDEVDTLLKKREALQSGSASSIGSMLGTLMSEWDGLNSDGKAPVLVLGATNRPMDIDEAFLRRMPLTVQTKAPDFRSRLDILTKMLRSDDIDEDVDLELIAASIDGFTGSDIREVCRMASIARMKAMLLAKKEEAASPESARAVQDRRPLKQVDFDNAITKSLQSGQRRADYNNEISLGDSREQVDMAQWLNEAISRARSQL